MPAEYASFAAEAHLLYARGAFPLDIVSREPQAVADWLGGRLPFHMTLPNYPAPSDRTGSREQKKYSLVARGCCSILTRMSHIWPMKWIASRYRW